MSKENHVLKIDFRSFDVEPHPLDLGDWQLITIDSGATHTHAGSGYNERRAECRAACEALGISTLRDATDLSALGGVLLKRARHVLTENERVEQTARALDARDLETVAQLLDESHASLRDDYEATRARGRADRRTTQGRRSRRRPDGRRRLRRQRARPTPPRGRPAGECPRRPALRSRSPPLTPRAAPAPAGA